jgi:putative ubiquitin-RnfH superfamily antitoxin RatB of RatAB toxin-antitoxin module
MENQNLIHIEVTYAKPDEQLIIPMTVVEGTTLKQAIESSGILTHFTEIDLSKNKVGIFSKACTLDTTLRERDRVEIYRALLADPKEVRKRLAAEGKTMKKGSGAV